MKKIINYFICVITALMLSSCAHRPTPAELSSADYGPYPENYEEIVKQGMMTQLYDPYSAQYMFQGTPEKKYLSRPLQDVIYGWGGFVLINAKNRMGGYVGATRFYYLIKNGHLVVCENAMMVNN